MFTRSSLQHLGSIGQNINLCLPGHMFTDKCLPIKCLTLTFAGRYGLRTHVHVHGYNLYTPNLTV